jgi:hypothetical protein
MSSTRLDQRSGPGQVAEMVRRRPRATPRARRQADNKFSILDLCLAAPARDCGHSAAGPETRCRWPRQTGSPHWLLPKVTDDHTKGTRYESSHLMSSHRGLAARRGSPQPSRWSTRVPRRYELSHDREVRTGHANRRRYTPQEPITLNYMALRVRPAQGQSEHRRTASPL